VLSRLITDAIATDDSNLKRLVAIDGKTNRRSHDHAKDLGALTSSALGQ